MILLQELLAKTNTFEWFDKVSIKFLSRFLVDIISVIILVRFIYFRHYRRTDLFLTFFGFNIIIFLITYLLNKVEMSMGAAFGLFAVFSMLRYRTENISAKDMTYLFFAIALGLITAISKGSWDDLGIMCVIMLALTALLEGGVLMKKEQTKEIVYDKIGLITPEKNEELIEDLKLRTGLDIHRVNIQEVDFLKDSTKIIIFYYTKK
ncbi:DUF4956 domain-containing protein [Lacihabitans lacunae]|jgi:hypothetical protein|uniref:DUF4956 domain-containing protein n=1 Tax=Lacihabitans lacunae TaxID=1028214 RepID=A0ABV7YUR3_9BACT